MYLRVGCKEKSGTYVRVVRSVAKDVDFIWWLYDRVKGLPNFITADTKNFTPESMLWLFLPHVQIFAVDEVGVVVVKRHADGRADVHITFWDKVLRGREMLAKRLANALLCEEGITVLETYIPQSSRAIMAFAKRVGFEATTPAVDHVQKLVYRGQVLS